MNYLQSNKMICEFILTAFSFFTTLSFIQIMTLRLSKLAEYLSTENYQMAINYYKENPNEQQLKDEEMQLLLAKAFFVNEDYVKSIDLLTKISNTPSLRIAYEAQILLYKAQYLMGNSSNNNFGPLTDRLNKEFGMNNCYTSNIMEIYNVTKGVSNRNGNSNLARSNLMINEKAQFQQKLKAEDDNSIVMEGMPMFLVSLRWYQMWAEYADRSQRIQKQKKHPGPITQFEITDHPFNYVHDLNVNKSYTNRYIFTTSRYKIIPKMCWKYLVERYGGTQIKRFNISFIEKPLEIMTEVYLRKIQIAKYQRDKPNSPAFKIIQITRKECWSGVKDKLFPIWGPGEIYQYDSRLLNKTKDEQILEEVDIVGKRYVYIFNEVKSPTITTQPETQEKCGNKKCQTTKQLKFCQCRSIKYCGMDCLKEDRSNHKKKCELQQAHLKQQSVIFKNFNLDEKDYGGNKGLVGLKNLGNTCYMNSGLQCLSNTKEITEYFMKDQFKNHINYSNPLGTKGNLACSYAQLIRQIWTGKNDVTSPFKLKKMIGNFASQFSGFGQQDSQQFISYLIDGLQQDLNLVKKKQVFESSDEVKPDEEMSKQSELNYSKRIQSYIRSIMAGQFKSTVVCSVCTKISICFDPYLLISLPIPSNQDWALFFVPQQLSRGSIKLEFEYNSSTTLRQLSKELTNKYNQVTERIRQKSQREKISEDQLVYMIIDSDKFNVVRIFEGNEPISSIKNNDFLFCYQMPACTKDEELLLAEFQFKDQRISFPRIFKFPKSLTVAIKQQVIYQALERGFQKNTYQRYSDLIIDEKILVQKGFPFKKIIINCKRKGKLLTYTEGYKEGFRGKLNQLEETLLTLDDCLRNFTQKQKLSKENSWYCGNCKDFKEAVKQMEIYKSNKIMVLAFKRFTRAKKIRTMVKYPIESLNMGPFLLSNKSKQPILYDLYAVVNHYGSLGGGHYTAFCQNFLNRRWYEFNDSRVSEISRNDIISGDSYVLFYRRRQN